MLVRILYLSVCPPRLKYSSTHLPLQHGPFTTFQDDLLPFPTCSAEHAEADKFGLNLWAEAKPALQSACVKLGGFEWAYSTPRRTLRTDDSENILFDNCTVERLSEFSRLQGETRCLAGYVRLAFASRTSSLLLAESGINHVPPSHLRRWRHRSARALPLSSVRCRR